jgi:hypothetical protein
MARPSNGRRGRAMLRISKSLFVSTLAVCGIAVSGIAVCAIAAPSAGQTAAAGQTSAVAQPRLSNANVRPVASSGALTAQFKALVDQQVEPAWIAYTQPIIDGTLASCC